MSTRIDKDFWIGIDLGKEEFFAAIATVDVVPSQWATLPFEKFQHSKKGVGQLAAWVSKLMVLGRCVGIVVESTGIYTRRFTKLVAGRKTLPQATVVNPARPKSFGASMGIRDKTDRADAAVLAVYGAVYAPRPRPERTGNWLELRDLSRLREDYMDDLGRTNNRLEQAESAVVRTELRSTVRYLEQKIERLEKKIRTLIKEDESMENDANLLKSIPGIGEKSAWLLLAELGDLRTWSRRELVGYVGLFPRHYESGTSVRRRPRLVRGGGHRIRKGLFYPACTLRRLNEPISEFGERLVASGKAKMSAICAMMRKLLLLARSVVVNGEKYDPNYSAKKSIA